MSRATVDLQGVRFFLGYGLIFFFQHVFTIVGVGSSIFLISWKLALITIAIAPVLIAVAYRYSHVSHPLLRDVQQKMADVATVAEENIVGVHVVKSFAQEASEQAKFERRSEEVFALSVKANRQRAFYIPLLSFLPLLAQAAILYVGGHMVANGTLSLGDFVALQPLPRAARAAAAAARHVDRPGAARDRLGRAHLPGDRRAGADHRRAGCARAAAGPGRIAFEDVTFGYDRRGPVLRRRRPRARGRARRRADRPHGLRQDDARRLVPRFYDVDRGRVTVDGADVRDVTLTSLRREIGVIAQDPFLFSATVRENIAFGRPDASEEEVERAARLAQAHEFIEALPEGYDTVIGERGITLSGGQRQRVAIARALRRRPAHPDPRRRHGVRRRDHGVEDPRRACARRCAAGRRSSSRTVSRRSRSQTRWSCSTTAASPHAATHDDLVETNDVYREIHDHGLLERVFTEEAA